MSREGDKGMPLETWRITPACQSRGHDVAWEDAVSSLKSVYDAQLERARRQGKQVTLTVGIRRIEAEADTGGQS